MSLIEFDVIDLQKRPAHCYLWASESKPPKCIVQLSHGMTEHTMRYSDFAKYLREQGYVFCGSDHPGHGLTIDRDDLGFFGEAGYVGAIDRLYCVTKELKKRYPDVPIVLLGHSMGSFMARAYITRYGSELSGVIVMGTSGPNPLLDAGKFVIKFLTLLKGEHGKSKMVNTLMFGAYNKRFDGNSNYLWLSKDSNIVKKYLEDDRCGFEFTLNGYKALTSVLGEVSTKKWAGEVPKDLPMLIVSGADDPVGDYGKGVEKVRDMLDSAGVKNIDMTIFENDRHEILNETDKEKVYAVLNTFIREKVLKTSE